jgi:hypothetical protein
LENPDYESSTRSAASKRTLSRRVRKRSACCDSESLAWLNEAADGTDKDLTTTQAASSGRHPLVEQLAAYISSHGVSHELIAEQIGASATAVGTWLRGTTPKAGSLQKIRAFLKEADAEAKTAEEPTAEVP